jgi:RNA polymerase sigma-70 factor (ECF subfamily)
VVGLLHSLCRNRALAEDLAQLTFLKVHKARDTYARGSPVEAWVFTIARRTFIDEWRKRARAREGLSEDGTLPEVAADVSSSPDAAGDQAGALRVLQGALEGMPANQREALMLVKVEGLSMVDAAAVAGISVGAMKVRAHRAYAHVRKLLGGAP